MEKEDDVEKLIQWSCRRCLGEFQLRHPFRPNFCPHCGAKLMVSNVTFD